MLDTALLILIGAFVGWHTPQPFWAKWIGSKVREWFNK